MTQRDGQQIDWDIFVKAIVKLHHTHQNIQGEKYEQFLHKSSKSTYKHKDRPPNQTATAFKIKIYMIKIAFVMVRMKNISFQKLIFWKI